MRRQVVEFVKVSSRKQITSLGVFNTILGRQRSTHSIYMYIWTFGMLCQRSLKWSWWNARPFRFCLFCAYMCTSWIALHYTVVTYVPFLLITFTCLAVPIHSVVVMVVPGPPRITYDPGQIVYDGTLLSLTCTSDTADARRTEVVWIQARRPVDGDVLADRNSVTNTIIVPAMIRDSSARYECHVIHPDLPEPLVEYANYSGTIQLTDTVLVYIGFIHCL